MSASVWCLLALFGFQSDQAIQESLRIEYILIDLIALNRQNQPVVDLSRDDFVVKDQGRKVALESFEILDFSDRTLSADGFSPTRLAQPAVEARQQFIFCVDLEHLNLPQTKKTFSQLRRAIKETELPQNADYLLFSLNYGAVTPEFVDSRDKLLTQLNLFEDRVIDMRRRSINGPSGEDEMILEIPDHRPKSRRGASAPLPPIGEPIGVGGPPQIPRGFDDPASGYGNPTRGYGDSSRDVIEEEFYKLMAKLGLLESLAVRFEDTPGLKTIFFISPGFSLNPGQVEMEKRRHMASKRFSRRTGADPATARPLESMLLPDGNSLHRAFERVIHTCTSNRVVFHTLNVYLTALETSGGLEGRPDRISDRNDVSYFTNEQLRENHKGLQQLALLSGGMVSRGADLQATLETWLPRLKVVYLLGYTSPEGTPDTYRKIKIKVKRKNTQLHYRRGYVSAP